jgi:hypothetical protein
MWPGLAWQEVDTGVAWRGMACHDRSWGSAKKRQVEGKRGMAWHGRSWDSTKEMVEGRLHHQCEAAHQRLNQRRSVRLWHDAGLGAALEALVQPPLRLSHIMCVRNHGEL